MLRSIKAEELLTIQIPKFVAYDPFLSGEKGEKFVGLKDWYSDFFK